MLQLSCDLSKKIYIGVSSAYILLFLYYFLMGVGGYFDKEMLIVAPFYIIENPIFLLSGGRDVFLAFSPYFLPISIYYFLKGKREEKISYLEKNNINKQKYIKYLSVFRYVITFFVVITIILTIIGYFEYEAYIILFFFPALALNIILFIIYRIFFFFVTKEGKNNISIFFILFSLLTVSFLIGFLMNPI